MLKSTVVNRTPLFAAATVISAVGFLVVPSPAQAKPLIPLAPACDSYSLGNGLQLNQDNDVVVLIAARQYAANPGGRSSYSIPGRTADTSGTASGGINGRAIKIDVKWTAGLGAGFSNSYTGQVDNDGIARGATVNNQGTINNWRSSGPLTCVTPVAAPTPPAPPAPPAAPAAPAAPTATVTSDVDYYDAPGGEGNVLGILRSGQVVQVVKPCPANDWCELGGPWGGTWVFGSFLRNN